MQSGGWYHTSCEEHADGGVLVGGDGYLEFGDRRYQFDVAKDDMVEIEAGTDQ